MVIGWVALVIGLAATCVGTALVASASAVSRAELTRWISRRLRGAAVASTMFSVPGQVLRTARSASAIGAITFGIGLATVIGRAGSGWWSVSLLVGGVIVLATLGYGGPRAIGRRWPEWVLRHASPWSDHLSAISKKARRLSSPASRARVTDMLLAGAAGEPLHPDEIKIISGVLAFTESTARDVMTPRTEIVAFEEGGGLEELGRVFNESGYSRLPVYRDSLDNIIGMMYVFDLLKVTPGGDLPIRPVAIAPGSKECTALFLDMQRDRRHLAVVLDEFGGTAGIVTMEDLLEELVGEIFDDDEQMAHRDDWGPEIVEMDGGTASSEVASRFGVILPDDAETIGGMLARAAGRIPQTGERLTLGELEFDVLGASPTRIDRIAVRRGPVRSVTLTAKPPA